MSGPFIAGVAPLFTAAEWLDLAALLAVVGAWVLVVGFVYAWVGQVLVVRALMVVGACLWIAALVVAGAGALAT